jgi:hypothetical protein
MASRQSRNDQLRVAMASRQSPSEQPSYDLPVPVRLLDPYNLHLKIADPLRYDPDNCSLCRRRLGRGLRAMSITCERCCAEIHDRCYWKIATAVERLSYDCDIIMGIFLCHGCRS